MLHKIGTLYLDGRLAKAGTMYQDGAKVAFGDAVPGYELFCRSIPGTTSFILAGHALLDISWRQLRDLGFVGGRPFLMDGKVYMVRLPSLGIKPPAGASSGARSPSSASAGRSRNSGAQSAAPSPTAGAPCIPLSAVRTWASCRCWTRGSDRALPHQ